MTYYKASNKHVIMRASNGRFRRTTGADLGIGVCPVEGCTGLTSCVYEGNLNDPMPDPRKFRQRCWQCEPETEAEKAVKCAEIEAAREQKSGFVTMLENAARSIESESLKKLSG